MGSVNSRAERLHVAAPGAAGDQLDARRFRRAQAAWSVGLKDRDRLPSPSG
jgi:hypothetical protein